MTVIDREGMIRVTGDVTVGGVREEGQRVNRHKSEVKRRFNQSN